MNWYVLRTKPRHEKKVAESLTRAGIENYLPLQKIVRQWSDRRKKVQDPLFKSYVFVRIEEKDRVNALKVYGAVNFVFWCGKPAIVREKEIEAIREFIGWTDYQEEHKIEFLPGSMIKVNAGLFNGREGEYIARQGKHVILLVESLGQMIRAEVPVAYVA